MKKINAHQGFTLIELLVTLTLMSILALTAMNVLELSMKRVKEKELKTALWEIRTAIDAWKKAADDGVIKKTTESGYPYDLIELEAGGGRMGGGKMYFIRRVPRDPFSDKDLNAYQSWGIRSYASDASLPLAEGDVYDVFSLQKEVGLNGEAYSTW